MNRRRSPEKTPISLPLALFAHVLSLSLVLTSFIVQIYLFAILPFKVLISTRLDPIVRPGAPLNHFHNILGGNRFSTTYNSHDFLSSSCTTSPITVDKSNYWSPGMYFMNKTTKSMKFIRISSTFNIYYLPRGDQGEAKALPEGFWMVAGDPNHNTLSEGLFEDHNTSWVFLGFNGADNGKDMLAFSATNCLGGRQYLRKRGTSDSVIDGIRGQFFFPFSGMMSIWILRIIRITFPTLFRIATTGAALLIQ